VVEEYLAQGTGVSMIGKIGIYLIIFLFFPIISWAEICHIVQKGETLWRISKKYGLTVRQLKQINGLRDNIIKPGQRLYIYSSNKYIVRKGDTLFSIARRFGCSVDEIKRLNQLYSDLIKISQILILPSSLPKICNTSDISKIKFHKYNNTSDIISRIIDKAKAYLGTPYKSGSKIGSGATDCSGFVKRTFGYFGITLPRTVREQFNVGIPVTGELKKGDLVFFATYASYPSHVGIYIGNGKFIHSSSERGGGVKISSLDSPYYCKRYLGARRIIVGE
jgi:LysM repeat protein